MRCAVNTFWRGWIECPSGLLALVGGRGGQMTHIHSEKRECRKKTAANAVKETQSEYEKIWS